MNRDPTVHKAWIVRLRFFLCVFEPATENALMRHFLSFFVMVWVSNLISLPIAAENLVETKQRAFAGDTIAQFNLGFSYWTGEGLQKDSAEAAKWFRWSAEKGYANAQFHLANMYEMGDGIPKNLFEALKWYHKAAEQGFAAAEYKLGLKYYKGKGVRKDFGEAVKWYRKAADQGNASAQFNLGLLCCKGEGSLKDSVEAYKWLTLAFSNGSEPAAVAMKRLRRRMTVEQISEAEKLVKAWQPTKPNQ